MARSKNLPVVMEYARQIVEREKVACLEDIQKCQRFLKDLENPAYDFRTYEPEFVIGIIEKTIVHQQGERLDGTPMRGKPFLLEPFQKFDIYNLLGFYKEGTNERRFKEALLYRPRKNAKTTYVACLAWALSLLEYRSGSKVYITSAALQQSMQSFEFLKFNINYMGEESHFDIKDNNNEHTISRNFADGSIYIRALAASPDKQDSLNCNIGIADEIHAYRTPKQYNIIKEAMKAYTNKMMIGISTAGDNMNSFLYRRVKYCQKVLAGVIKDEQYYISISKAPEDEDGNVDILDPKVHEMANPMYGVTIRPDDIMNDARQAYNDPQQRKDFLAKSLNVYTSAMKAYFNIKTFQRSNAKAGKKLGFNPNWTLEEKIKHARSLNLTWYGGTDLSRLHDLTAAVLVAKTTEGVWLVLPHAWFPIVAAHKKADEDNIPLFGWRDEGWLTMSNNPTVNYSEIVNWYLAMKRTGLKIKHIGHDRRFAKEYITDMQEAGFKINDQRQYDWVKQEGFRLIDTATRNNELYYFDSDAYEYCVMNVRYIEKLDKRGRYEKVDEEARIDIFDASVMAVCQLNDDREKQAKVRRWLDS